MDHLTNDDTENDSSWFGPDFIPGLGVIPARTWKDPVDPPVLDDDWFGGGVSEDAAVELFGGQYDP